VTIPIAAEPAAEAAEQKDDEDDDENESDGHGGPSCFSDVSDRDGEHGDTTVAQAPPAPVRCRHAWPPHPAAILQTSIGAQTGCRLSKIAHIIGDRRAGPQG
jgi:hypothetical protein